MPDKIEINRHHDWPTFVETRLKKTREYADRCEAEIKYLKQDRISGWFAAGMLVIVLGIVLYQWHVAGVCPIPVEGRL